MIPPSDCTSIEEVRSAIDTIDRDILSLLGQRFQYVKTITRFKKTVDDVRAPERYHAVLAKRREWAAAEGLNPDTIEEMYRLLIAHFIDEELKEMRLPANEQK